MSGCDSGTPTHLDDGEPKRLLERDVGEDTPGAQRQPVDVRDVALLVLLGVGHAAVQVVGVDQLQHLVQHLLGAGSHAVDVVAVPLPAAGRVSSHSESSTARTAL